MTAPEAPLLLTLDEAAVVLNISRNWLSDAVSARAVQCTRLGRHIRFSRADLDLLIAQRCQPAVGAALRSSA